MENDKCNESPFQIKKNNKRDRYELRHARAPFYINMSDVESEEFPSFLYGRNDGLDLEDNEDENQKNPKLLTDFSFLKEYEEDIDKNKNFKEILSKSCDLSEDKIELFTKLFESSTEVSCNPYLEIFNLHIIKKPIALNLPLPSKLIKSSDLRILQILDMNPSLWSKILIENKYFDIQNIFDVATKVGPKNNGHGFKFIRHIYKKYSNMNLWVITPSELMRTLSYLGSCFPRKFIGSNKFISISATLLSGINYEPRTYNDQIKLIVSETIKTIKIMFEHYIYPSNKFITESAIQIASIFLIIYFDPIIHIYFTEISDLVATLLKYCKNAEITLLYEYCDVLVSSLNNDKNKLSLFPLLRQAHKYNKNFLPIYGLICLYTFLPKSSNDEILMPNNYSLYYLTNECFNVCKIFLAEKEYHVSTIRNIFYVFKELLIVFHDLPPDEYSKSFLIYMKKINSKLHDTSLTESYVKNQITKMINLYSCLLRSYSNSIFKVI